jgi:hypothetical protein
MCRPAASFLFLFLLLASCAAVPATTPASSTIARASRPFGSGAIAAGEGAKAGSSSVAYAEAQTALRAAEGGLHSCNASAVPTELDVTLRFEPSGRVGNVDVVPNAGRVASCVRSRLAEITLVPFAGEPVTLRKRVTL